MKDWAPATYMKAAAVVFLAAALLVDLTGSADVWAAGIPVAVVLLAIGVVGLGVRAAQNRD